MLSQRARSGGGVGGGLGGLGDLLGQLTQKGYGRQAQSWVGTGANEALPPQAIDDVFGQDELHRIAQQAGVNDDEARAGLSELLPDLVDHFTPSGSMPDGEQLSASVDDYLRRLR
ncbi:YidB family protein [Variovorax defluvii]